MKNGNLTCDKAYEMFMFEQHFRKNSERTIEWYEFNLLRFLEWLPPNSDVNCLTLDVYKQYIIYVYSLVKRNGEPLLSSSVNTYTRPVKAFYNFLIEENYIPDISRKLRTTKIEKTEKEILTDDEVSKIWSCFGDDNLSLRNKCICVLMLDSGLRRGEIPRLKVIDVNIKDKWLLVNGKGNKQRYVPLGQQSRRLLKSYYKKYRSGADETAPFFVDRFGGRMSDNAIKLVFQDLKEKTGIKRLHPHLLRHTFATNYILDGGNLETLRIILGHSDIGVTQVYLHMAQNALLLRSEHLSHLDKIRGD